MKIENTSDKYFTAFVDNGFLQLWLTTLFMHLGTIYLYPLR